MSAVYGKQGEVVVCFHEDGHFYAVVRSDLGYDEPDFGTKLVSVGDEWHHAHKDALTHNEMYQQRFKRLAVEVEAE